MPNLNFQAEFTDTILKILPCLKGGGPTLVGGGINGAKAEKKLKSYKTMLLKQCCVLEYPSLFDITYYLVHKAHIGAVNRSRLKGMIL